MFKRVVIVGLAGILLLSCNVGFCGSLSQSKTYVKTNNTGHPTIENVSTSTFIPGFTQIIGFSVKGVAGTGVTPWADLYDATSSTSELSESILIGECESLANLKDREDWSLYPKKVSNGLTIHIGAYTIVEVHYTER